MSNASLVKPLRSGGSIGADKLAKILRIYPDLNPAWLLTGKGEMLISKPKVKKTYKEAEGVSVLEEPQIKYENKISALEKNIEELNRILQKKDEQLREKDSQISRLIQVLEK